MFQSGITENVKKKMLFNPIYWVNVFIKPFFIGDSFFLVTRLGTHIWGIV